MWFGTKGGLSRYDGMSFRNFKREMTDNHSLGNNFVTCLYQDNKEMCIRDSIKAIETILMPMVR